MKIMKTLKILTALLVVSVGDGWAWDGERDFEGTVKEGSCEVSTNSRDMLVILPTVATNLLRKAGDTAGDTPFSIRLVRCDASEFSKVQLSFKALSFMPGILENRATKNFAKNVKLKITKPDGSLVTLSNGKDDLKAEGTGVGEVQPRFDYIVQYYAVGQASAGNVEASIQFEIHYR